MWGTEIGTNQGSLFSKNGECAFKFQVRWKTVQSERKGQWLDRQLVR
jgi:hypothetical protein